MKVKTLKVISPNQSFIHWNQQLSKSFFCYSIKSGIDIPKKCIICQLSYTKIEVTKSKEWYQSLPEFRKYKNFISNFSGHLSPPNYANWTKKNRSHIISILLLQDSNKICIPDHVTLIQWWLHNHHTWIYPQIMAWCIPSYSKNINFPTRSGMTGNSFKVKMASLFLEYLSFTIYHYLFIKIQILEILQKPISFKIHQNPNLYMKIPKIEIKLTTKNKTSPF